MKNENERVNLRYRCGHTYAPYHDGTNYTAPFREWPDSCPSCKQEAHYKLMIMCKTGKYRVAEPEQVTIGDESEVVES